MSANVSRPLVSIGLPVYNGERYLAGALDSLIGQTYTDLEIIVCDNASTDASADIAREYEARDSRVRLVRNRENLGAARNFCLSFELTRGPYFRWATADDVSAPQFVERCVDVLEARPDVVQAYPRTRLIDEHGTVISDYDDNLHVIDERPSIRFREVTRRLRLVNALYGVIRSDALHRTAVHGSYIGSDLPLMAEIALYGKIWEIPEYLFFRRMHPEAQSQLSRLGQQQHYNPGMRSEFSYREWRHLWERLRSVSRSSIGASEMVATSAFILRDAVASRDVYLRELQAGLSRHST